MNGSFDLIYTQQKMREIDCPKKLFEEWERVSYAYLRKELSRNELDEVKAVVWRQFRLLDATAKLSNRAA